MAHRTPAQSQTPENCSESSSSHSLISPASPPIRESRREHDPHDLFCARRQNGPCLTIEFDGSGFLYKMVRLMVGSLVKSALGKMRIEDVKARLDGGHIGSARLTASPKDYFWCACAIDKSYARAPAHRGAAVRTPNLRKQVTHIA